MFYVCAAVLADFPFAAVLDWDDTCLASSYLASHGYCLDAVFTRKPEVEEQLRELEVGSMRFFW